MKENVGRLDRGIRSVVGPALVAVGYARFGGKEGRPLGLLAMIAGATVTESAVTRVCPLNALFGIDSRSTEEVIRDLDETLTPIRKDLDSYQEQVMPVRSRSSASS